MVITRPITRVIQIHILNSMPGYRLFYRVRGNVTNISLLPSTVDSILKFIDGSASIGSPVKTGAFSFKNAPILVPKHSMVIGIK